MTVRRCPCCGMGREEGKYLCASCWGRIPESERAKLRKQGRLAGVRLIELIKQLQTGVPPEEVRVST